MTKLERIEQELQQLSAEEMTQFRRWFHGYDGALWDQQLERDAVSGKLDKFANEALSEHLLKRTSEL